MSEKSQLTLNTGDLNDQQDGNLVLEKQSLQLKPPSMYQVVLLNDDYTPMEFVVELLRIFFYFDEEKATQIMLQIHTEGKGVCGVYPKDIAETKANEVNDFSRENGHPLMCLVQTVE